MSATTSAPTDASVPAPSSLSPASSAPTPPLWLYLAWVIALGSMLASLFFGEVMKLPPCTLCWYQRICLYPLVVLLPIGIFRRDRHVVSYALPLVVIGLAIAVYHNLLFYGVIAEELSPCTAGVPCTKRLLNWFGFIDIPLMGLAAFLLLLVSLVAHERNARVNPVFSAKEPS